MSAIVSAIVSGVLIGCFYTIVGLGISLIYGVMKVTNFAHGDFLMLGGYIAFLLYASFNLNPFLSIPIAMATLFIIGLAVYEAVVRNLMKTRNPEESSLIALYGMSISLSAFYFILCGADYRSIPYTLPVSSISILGTKFLTTWVLGSALSIAIALGLFQFLHRTYTGKAIRAVISNVDEARCSGIDVNQVCRLAFAIGLAVAGVAGAMLPLFQQVINPAGGIQYTVLAFMVACIGGLNNPLGVTIGGLFVGVCQSISNFILPGYMWPLVLALIAIIILSIRPMGLLYR